MSERYSGELVDSGRYDGGVQAIQLSPIREGSNRVARALESLDRTVDEIQERFADVCSERPQPDSNNAPSEARGGSALAQLFEDHEIQITRIDASLRRILRNAEL